MNSVQGPRPTGGAFIKRAIEIIAKFGSETRRNKSVSHKVVLQNLVDTLAGAYYADRTAVYIPDFFGYLSINTANRPEVIEQSHVKDIKPEGPLATVLENHGFVFVPDILRPDSYYLLDHLGNFKVIDNNPLNPQVTRNYQMMFSERFKASGELMSMMFGCLCVPDKVFGAFKADAFESGRSILPQGMTPQELLNMVSIVSGIASQNLEELDIRLQLEKARDQAEALYRGFRQLGMKLTHDIGTAAVNAHGHLFRAQAESEPAAIKEHVELGMTSMNRIIALANGAGTTISQGILEITVETGPTKLHSIFNELRSEPNVVIEAVDPALPRVIISDEKNIMNILSELIKNAKKYQAPDAPVTINCRVAGQQIDISVRDEGVGLTAAEVEKLRDPEPGVRFQPYLAEGNGWGVYTQLQAARKFGGTITAESPGLGRGSTFHLIIPLIVPEQAR